MQIILRPYAFLEEDSAVQLAIFRKSCHCFNQLCGVRTGDNRMNLEPFIYLLLGIGCIAIYRMLKNRWKNK